MPSLLELSNVTASYGAATVLHGVDLAVEAGSVTAILGANGAGKTTLLRAISRMVHSTGQIFWERAEISGMRTEQVARLGIAHVPDGRGTFASLSVADNLALGALAANRSQGSGMKELVYRYFPKLQQRERQQAGTLSGGEQQMLAIGRALMGRPRLMLLDEPSVGLAPLVVSEIFSILREVNATLGISMLLVEQNAAKALALAKHAYVIESGAVVMSGPAKSVAADGRVRRAYLGA